MKKIIFAALAGLALIANVATAQVYPYSNSTYIPNIRPAAFIVASNVAAPTVTLNNIGTVTLQLTGTCTSLVGILQASNDGTNWATLNMYANGALTTASAVASVSGVTGMWSANTGGHNLVRMNNTGVSGVACVGTIAGSPTAFSLPH